jgi:hypothetical protein
MRPDFFLFFVPVCVHSNKGTRFEKRKRVCRRVEIQRGTGGFNCRKREQYPAATDHVDRRHSGNVSRRLRTATLLRSTQSYLNRAQRRARGSATYVCACRRDSTTQCERSSLFAWPRPPLHDTREMACLRSRLHGGYMAAVNCDDTAWKCLYPTLEERPTYRPIVTTTDYQSENL